MSSENEDEISTGISTSQLTENFVDTGHVLAFSLASVSHMPTLMRVLMR